MATDTLSQPSLFAESFRPVRGSKTELETRRKAAENAAHAAKNQACLEAYEIFVKQYARTHQVFTTDDISRAYLETDLPRPGKDLRCTSVLITRLKREGVLLETGRLVKIAKWGKEIPELTSPLWGK